MAKPFFKTVWNILRRFAHDSGKGKINKKKEKKKEQLSAESKMLQLMESVNIHDLIELPCIIPFVKPRSKVHNTEGEWETANLGDWRMKQKFPKLKCSLCTDVLAAEH